VIFVETDCQIMTRKTIVALLCLLLGNPYF